MSKLHETLIVYRRKDFRNLWLGSLTANAGAMTQAVAAAWLMTLLSPSQTMVALVQAAATFPLLIAGYLSGILADTSDRRRIMLMAQVLMLVIAILLMVLYQANVMTPWLLLILTFLLGSGAVLHAPSWQASLGDLVPRDELAAAVSINGMGLNLTRSLGPAIGGILVTVGGVMAGFVANALSYPVLIWALLGWKPPAMAPKRGYERFASAFSAGLRYYFRSPFQQRATLRAMLYSFAACIILSLLPVIVRDHFKGGALLFGILYACFGLGATCAALGSGYIRAVLGHEALLRLGFLTTSISVATIAFSPWPVLTAIAVIITGMSWLIVNSLTNVMIQIITPRWVVGRVVALFMTGIAVGTTLGAWVWGMTAEFYGAQTALQAAAAVLFVGLLWGLWAPMPEFSETDVEPVAMLCQPQSEIPISPSVGPIRITIEYDINPDDSAEFLRMMEQRRLLKQRAGMLDWSLHRDVETPRLWLESYDFRDWAEYLRSLDRRVAGEVRNADELLKLHRGALPQRIHRTRGARHLIHNG